MSNPTKCPNNTPWCMHHESFTDEWGSQVERCLDWLYVTRAPIAISEAPPVATLYLSNSRSASHSSGPGLAMTVFGSIPWGIQPEHARALAGALLKGAEIVEASRTGVCGECGCRVFPADLEDDGTCYGCQNRRLRALRSLMRGES